MRPAAVVVRLLMMSETHPRSASVGELPQYFCPVCTSVRYWREPACADCGAVRPADGWEPLEHSSDPLLGRTVDRRFFITRRVSRCGPATIYRASCLTVSHHFGLWSAPLDRFDCDRNTFYQRMEREVRLARGVDSPHIVPVHEFLELPDQRAAVVMDYIDGPCLARMVGRGSPLDFAHACALGTQLARGLHAAHQAGVVHRQLDPGAILVEQLSDGKECVRLVNFGLARLETSPTETLDSDDFASPEQRRDQAPDVRSNVYSAGAIIYYMLTGEAPLETWNSGGTWGVRGTKPPPVSQVRGTDEVPAEIDQLLGSMLSRKPEQRPASLADAVGLLELFAAFETPVGDDESGAKPGLDEITAARQTTALPPEEERRANSTLIDSGKHVGLADETSTFSREKENTRPRTLSLPELSLSHTLEKRVPREELPADLDPQSSVSFWPDSERTTGDFGSVQPPKTGTDRTRLDDTPKPATVVCAGGFPDSGFALGDGDKTLWLVDSDALDAPSKLLVLPEAVHSVTCCDMGAVAGLDDGTVVFVEEGSNSATVLLETIDRAAITGVSASADGGHLIACARSGRIYLGAVDPALTDHDWGRVRSNEPALDISLSSRADTFAVLREGGQIEVRKMVPPQASVGEFSVDASVEALVISGDGQLVAVASATQVSLHHAYSGQQIARFDGPAYTPLSVHFNAANDLLALGRDDDGLLLWNVATGEPVAVASRQHQQ